MVGIPLTLLTLYYSPSLKAMGWVAAWCFLVAGYFVWRADHIRLEKKIVITQAIPHRWTDERGDVTLWDVELINKSEAFSVYKVRVQLLKIEPEVATLNWLPVPLQQKHDNPIPGIAHTPAREFDLNPRELKHIDFVWSLRGLNHFKIMHIASRGINQNVPIAQGINYRLNVVANAGHIPDV